MPFMAPSIGGIASKVAGCRLDKLHAASIYQAEKKTLQIAAPLTMR